MPTKIGCLLIFSVGVYFASRVTISKVAIYYYRIGGKLLEDGKYVEAIPKFQTSIYWNPNFAPSHNYLALSYYKAGQVESAIFEFKQTLNLSPSYLAAHYYLAQAYISASNVLEARKELQKVIQLDGEGAWGRYAQQSMESLNKNTVKQSHKNN